MPSQKKVHWAQLKVGVMAIIAFVILSVLIVLLTGSSHPFSKKAPSTPTSGDSAAMMEGSAVRLNGILVGKVTPTSAVIQWHSEKDLARLPEALHQIFKKAKQSAPCILFFDEIDGLISARGSVRDGKPSGIYRLEKANNVRDSFAREVLAFIDEECDIGPNCYIRPFTSIGRNVRIGNACEVKNSLILDDTHIGHLSYVGDSIIGENCNFGAGTITANLRFDKKNIKVKIKDRVVDSSRTKLGVIMGDNVQTGIGTRLMLLTEEYKND
jgi:hypothetical protein